MSSNNHSLSRRSLLKGIAILPVAALGTYQSTAFAEMLSVDDPTAKALGYVEVSVVDGKTCANCSLYASTGPSGPCAIFPGKEVAGAGYCNSWVPKA